MTPDREAAFWEHQKTLTTNRAPLCCSTGIETGPPIIKPSRYYGWLIWPALVVGFGVVIAIASI